MLNPYGLPVVYSTTGREDKLQQAQNSQSYDIAYQAGSDLAVVIPDLPGNIVVREAYRYHRSVVILNIPLDECIEAYAAGYREEQMTQQNGKEESESFYLAYQAGVDEAKEVPGLSDSELVRKALAWYQETSRLMSVNMSDGIRGYCEGFNDYLKGIV